VQTAALAFREAAHVGDQPPQGGHEFRLPAVQIFPGGGQGGFRNAQGGRIQADAIKALGPIQNRRQPAPAHIRQDGCHGLSRVPIRFTAPPQRGHPPGQVRPVR